MGTQGKRAMARLGLGVVVLTSLWACADGGTDTSLGGGGTGLTASGSGGSTPSAAGMGGRSGMGAAGTAGSSPMAGAQAAGMGGTTAGTGSPSAGTGGTSATAGTGGAAGMAGMPASGDALIRGPEPTMDTVMKNGPYKFESYTDGFKDGAEYLAGTIYHPTDADPPYAAVVICPGFTAYQDSVAPWGPFFASHGIVAMTIDTNTALDSVLIRQGALMDALESLKGEQMRSGSPLMGKLHMTRFGLMGWSMGGGATWLNVNEHPELKSGISLAGHNATAGGAGLLTNVTVPVLMLAGSADTGILGLAMSQPVYEMIPASTPKILYEIEGASHFDISPTTGGGLFGLYGLSWQKVFLEGDVRYRKFLTLPKPANASDFRSNVM
jgi:hypothetical protein